MFSIFKTGKYKFLLFAILLLRAVGIVCLILFSSIDLSPDEAQYWSWSQALDWGYYSKPPGIAWQIWLTTKLFGSTTFGVRFGALVIGTCLAWCIYLLAKWGQLSEKAAFWSAIVFAFSPLGFYFSFAATTDGGAILFFTLAVGFTTYALSYQVKPNYYLIGGCIFLGALFKWIAFAFFPFLLLFLFFYKELRSWHLFGGIVVALLSFLPTIYWNQTHDWATFKHVATQIVGKTTKGNFFDFLAAQIGLLFPLFFIFLLGGIWKALTSYRRPLIFIAMFPLATLIYFFLALFKKMQPNWAAYLYPPGMVLAAFYPLTYLKKGKDWLLFGTSLSLLLIVGACLIPTIQEKNFFPFQIPYKMNPFRHEVGWKNLPQALKDSGYHPKKDFLFGDKYQVASLLSFYGPSQKRAYFFNLNGIRRNQFSYWPQMSEKEIGHTGYFVVLEHMKKEDISWYRDHYISLLAPYFETVDLILSAPLFLSYEKPMKYALIFKCTKYNGKSPDQKSITY